MRIKSNFRDYYDGLQSLDTDKNTLWIRQQKRVEVILNKNTPKNIRYFFEDTFRMAKCYRNVDTYTYWLIVGIAGKMYPIWVKNKRFIYDQSKQPTVRDYCFYNYHYKQNPWYQIYINDEMLLQHMFDTYGPVWSIGTGELAESINFVNCNPRLADYGFHKFMPVHEIYNELYKFLCNSQRLLRPIPEMDNDTKIHQAGFDLKTSFRKSKK